MVKYNKTKKGGFFLFNINKNKNKNKNSKNKNKNNKNKNKNKKHVTLDGSECWEQHNIWQLQKRNNNCNCYCLSKHNNILNKKFISNNYNECLSGDIIKKKDSVLCESGKYIWTSDKSKSFPLSKKCAGNKSCWGK